MDPEGDPPSPIHFLFEIGVGACQPQRHCIPRAQLQREESTPTNLWPCMKRAEP